jgi:hypothetical protein
MLSRSVPSHSGVSGVGVGVGVASAGAGVGASDGSCVGSVVGSLVGFSVSPSVATTSLIAFGRGVFCSVSSSVMSSKSDPPCATSSSLVRTSLSSPALLSRVA